KIKSRIGGTMENNVSGGPIQILGPLRVGSYVVQYSDPKKRATDKVDCASDYFTEQTFFRLPEGTIPILYGHGLHPRIGNRRFGQMRLTKGPDGIWGEGELHDDPAGFGRMFMQNIKDGMLGWSTGGFGKAVRIETDFGRWVSSWTPGESSLTPAPC